MDTNFGKTLERDARNCLLWLLAIVVGAFAMGAGAYHLFLSK